MSDDDRYRQQLRRRAQQCQANTSAFTTETRSRYWHICQDLPQHGGLHQCYCGQCFDDTGAVYRWSDLWGTTRWKSAETNGEYTS